MVGSQLILLQVLAHLTQDRRVAHYAKVVEGIVETVIVADQEWIDTLDGTWVQTSYNTRGGVHYGQDLEPDGGVPLRKNYASIGDTYDPVRDAFIPQKPFSNWILNEDTCLWVPPIARPDDGKNYIWNQDTTSWMEIED